MSRVRIDYPGPTLFVCEIPVRISDLNYGNHLGHDALISILHEARVRFFRNFEMEELDVGGAGILLVDLAVAYKAQVFYGQVLKIEIAIGDVSSRGCDLVYRVTDRDSDTLVALAKTGIVFFDYEKNRVVSMPARFRAVVEGQAKGRQTPRP